MSGAEAGGPLDEFLWGTATSAHQVEGGNVHNDWWDHERRFTASGAACDFVRRFEEDLDRARDMGTNAFRFSLEWSRIEPRPGEQDPAAIEYYARVIRACHARGLRPMMTLIHFTLPRWCAAQGGWLSEATHVAFERHARWVAARFVGEVDLFVTVNEPNVQAGAGYLSGVFPPGRRLRPDLAKACEASLVRAHVTAHRALHEEVARRHPGRRIAVGCAQQVIAWRRSRADLLGIVWREARRFNWGFLDAAPKETLDFVGINYYMSLPARPIEALRFAGFLKMPVSAGTSDLGWPIDAGGFEEVLLEADRRYSRPIIVTENGIACASDARRPSYLAWHIEALGRARAAGADVRGYLHWSLIDNFEWHAGYGPRFGLFEIDYATQKRTARPSAKVYRRIIAEARASDVRETLPRSIRASRDASIECEELAPKLRSS